MTSNAFDYAKNKVNKTILHLLNTYPARRRAAIKESIPGLPEQGIEDIITDYDG